MVTIANIIMKFNDPVRVAVFFGRDGLLFRHSGFARKRAMHITRDGMLTVSTVISVCKGVTMREAYV